MILSYWNFKNYWADTESYMCVRLLNMTDRILNNVDQLLTKHWPNHWLNVGMCWLKSDEWFLELILYTICISHSSINRTMHISFSYEKMLISWKTRKYRYVIFSKDDFLIFQKLIFKFTRSLHNFFRGKFRSFLKDPLNFLPVSCLLPMVACLLPTFRRPFTNLSEAFGGFMSAKKKRNFGAHDSQTPFFESHFTVDRNKQDIYRI